MQPTPTPAAAIRIGGLRPNRILRLPPARLLYTHTHTPPTRPFLIVHIPWRFGSCDGWTSAAAGWAHLWPGGIDPVSQQQSDRAAGRPWLAHAHPRCVTLAYASQNALARGGESRPGAARFSLAVRCRI